jgi:hypothetical protein
MAGKQRSLSIQTPVLGSFPALRSKNRPMPERKSVKVLDLPNVAAPATDLVLYHNGIDANWSGKLAERIRGERSGNLHLVAQLATWNLSTPTEILAEAEKCLSASRFFGLVFSAPFLREDWPALEKLILLLSDLGLAKGRFVTILKENAAMPPFLRLHEWIDFRDGHYFEDSARGLVTLLREDPSHENGSRLAMEDGSGDSAEPSWKTRPLFAGAKKLSERILSNLFPAVEIPKYFFSAETRYQTESEILEACGSPGPLPFLLNGSRLYTAAPPSENSVFGPALREDSKPSQEHFSEWLSDSERAPRAIELLNHLLRYHAWKRGMRFDEGQNLFYFTRSKPKNLWWEIGGKTIQREVTAPNTKWNQIGDHGMAEFQCGWKHEAIRASFIQLFGALFMRMEPAWFLTELDGKTPSTTQRVEPLTPYPQNQDSNAQVLRTLRFWSAVFAKGHRELRIDTGTNPIRVRLTPASGCIRSKLSNDQMDFDSLALAEIDRAELIPELGPIEQ